MIPHHQEVRPERLPGHGIPSWAALVPALVGAARAWTQTTTLTAEHDYLVEHPQLVDPAAAEAIEEALLTVPTDDRDRYRGLVTVARGGGIAAAYRPDSSPSW